MSDADSNGVDEMHLRLQAMSKGDPRLFEVVRKAALTWDTLAGQDLRKMAELVVEHRKAGSDWVRSQREAAPGSIISFKFPDYFRATGPRYVETRTPSDAELKAHFGPGGISTSVWESNKLLYGCILATTAEDYAELARSQPFTEEDDR